MDSTSCPIVLPGWFESCRGKSSMSWWAIAFIIFAGSESSAKPCGCCRCTIMLLASPPDRVVVPPPQCITSTVAPGLRLNSALCGVKRVVCVLCVCLRERDSYIIVPEPPPTISCRRELRAPTGVAPPVVDSPPRCSAVETLISASMWWRPRAPCTPYGLYRSTPEVG